MTKHSNPIGPKKVKEGYSYKEILQRKAAKGDKFAEKTLKELGKYNGVFDNYYS